VLLPAVTRQAREALEPELDVEEKKKRVQKASIVVTTFFIACGALVFRLGGRAAFLNLLGLDFMVTSDIGDKVNEALSFLHSLGSLQYVAFFLAWLVAKVLLLDFLTIILAISSGVLFGGLLQGTALSVLCSSSASLVVFLTARYLLQDAAREDIKKRPFFRAIDRAVSKNAFKTVFTLRLSPLLPIPIAAYNYVYALTSVNIGEFVAGISLGSVKPYLLDSYLGLFGKSVLDKEESGAGDAILLAVVAIVFVVGTFAAQVVGETWDEVQKEAELEGEALGVGKKLGMTDMMGWNQTEASEKMRFAFDLPFVKDLQDASRRVELTIEDELAAVTKEYNDLNVKVGWNVSEVLPANASSTQVVSNQYVYPGVRTLRAFERIPPNAGNVKEYLFESIVFSFVLMGFIGKSYF